VGVSVVISVPVPPLLKHLKRPGFCFRSRRSRLIDGTLLCFADGDGGKRGGMLHSGLFFADAFAVCYFFFSRIDLGPPSV